MLVYQQLSFIIKNKRENSISKLEIIHCEMRYAVCVWMQIGIVDIYLREEYYLICKHIRHLHCDFRYALQQTVRIP